MAVNDWLQAEVIRHELELRKHANGVVAKIIAVLNRSDSRLFGELQAALESMDADSFSVERLEALLTSVRSLNAAAYANMERELDDVLREFVGYEAAYQRQMLITAAPVVSVAGVSTDMVYAAAMRRPFQGVLLRSVWPDLSDSRMKLIRRTIAQGFVESRTTAQIVRDLRGTKVQGYADGLVNRSRREVEAVVRTALGHYAGVTQDSVMEANSDLVKAVKWVSTLDARTSEQCRLRDGLLYEPVSHKPIGHKVPWGAGPGRLHWNCRSTQTPITKSWRELGVDMDEVPAGTRASMDGQVPAETTYLEWLGKRPAGVQDEVLGPTRAKLYRDGKLPMDRMYGDKGQWLSIDQLRARDAAAFKRAGM